MLYQTYATAVKEFKVLLKDRGALALLFIMPLAFILVFAGAGSGASSVGTEESKINLLVVNQDGGGLAGEVLDQLRTMDGVALIETVDGMPLTRDTAEDGIVAGDAPVAVIFPDDFSNRIVQAATDPNVDPATVTFIVDPATDSRLINPIQGTVVGFIERAVAYAQAPRRLEDASKIVPGCLLGASWADSEVNMPSS